MGTRHLIAVIANGERKVAQYGQWDGYPSGQGIGVLNFCREHLDTPQKRLEYANLLDKYTIFTNDEGRASSKYNNRDLGSDILDMLRQETRIAVLVDCWDFAGNSLFCEWAYVVDLDHSTLEVYIGRNEKPLPPQARFADLKGFDGYHPVRLLATISLDKIPSIETFLKVLGD